MKKIAYIYTVLCAIVMVITVVNCKDEVLLESRLQTDMKDFSLEEAKNFFQTQARDNLMLSRSLDNKKNETVSPGDFVPNWDAAVGSVNNGLACYDIPITPTYHFKAIYVDERNGKPSAGKVNVYQKLVIVKDVKSNRMDQYILTLIPSQLYDSRNGSQTCNNFINCADKGGFTGVALYSCVYSQVTARISTYKNGVKTGGVFLLNASGKTNLSNKYEQARALASAVYIQKKKMVLTRGEDDYDYTYDGGWFDDIIIEPEPDYSEWGENDNEDWLNSSSPDTTPIDPEPTEPESTSQEDDTVTENNNGDQKPIQSQDFIAAKGDKFVISKLPDRMEKQIGYTCVTSIISYIELAMKGTADYDSNGVLKVNHGAILQEYINYQKELNSTLSTEDILKDVLKNGINMGNIPAFIDRLFTTVPADNITIIEAIDRGYIIMTAVASEMGNSAHNVAIIGYHTNGNLIYMDSEYGHWREAPVSSFGLYAYVISGVK